MRKKKKKKMNYKIVAKYIKDLKFEIPNPKTFFLLEKDIASYKVKIDIKSNQFKEKIIEVETTLALDTSREDLDKINTKIIYSTLIEIDGTIKEKKQLEEIILIKVPTEVFSEIRSLFILLFEKSGFNQIKIDKDVDFKELYKSRFVQ